MLTVTIKNGDENSKEFWVNDLGDLKIVQGAITDEFQKVLAQDKSEEKIQLERILDFTDFDDVDDLIKWTNEMKELEDDINHSNYDNIEDMLEQLDNMSCVLSDVYYAVRDFN